MRKAIIARSIVVLSVGLTFGTASMVASINSPDSLREALTAAGISEALSEPGSATLDRALTSSRFCTSSQAFVAAYYFVDEITDRQILGPIHISRFDRHSRAWTHVSDLDRGVGGSVMDVQCSGEYVLIDLHQSPSAGLGLVLGLPDLKVVATLKGFGFRMMQDGAIRYSANMIHFAPTHQERLLAFDPRGRQSLEIFPGNALSPIASNYGRAIRRSVMALSEPDKSKLRDSPYGLPNDFSRSIGEIVERASGGRIAFDVAYNWAAVAETPPAAIKTVARCDRRRNSSWACTERELEEAGREIGIQIARDRDGVYPRSMIDAVVQGLLARP